MNHSQLTIEAINDPSEIALHQPHWERSERNWAWLRDHWADLLPQAFGKFLAVAGEEALVADSLEEALTWAKTAHPEDTGRIVEYLTPPQGPRCWSSLWQMVSWRWLGCGTHVTSWPRIAPPLVVPAVRSSGFSRFGWLRHAAG